MKEIDWDNGYVYIENIRYLKFIYTNKIRVQEFADKIVITCSGLLDSHGDRYVAAHGKFIATMTVSKTKFEQRAEKSSTVQFDDCTFELDDDFWIGQDSLLAEESGVTNSFKNYTESDKRKLREKYAETLSTKVKEFGFQFI